MHVHVREPTILYYDIQLNINIKVDFITVFLGSKLVNLKIGNQTGSRERDRFVEKFICTMMSPSINMQHILRVCGCDR